MDDEQATIWLRGLNESIKGVREAVYNASVWGPINAILLGLLLWRQW